MYHNSCSGESIALNGKIKILIVNKIRSGPDLYTEDSDVSMMRWEYIYVNGTKYTLKDDRLSIDDDYGFRIWQIQNLPKLLSDLDIDRERKP